MKACSTKRGGNFLRRGARGIGAMALASMLGEELTARDHANRRRRAVCPGLPHFAPKAKRAIYLHLVGAPPQMDLSITSRRWPRWFDKDLPDSIRRANASPP